MSKLPSRKLLASLVAGALFLPQTGYPLGLGEIEVNSALNQKLNADIELLSATPEDAETIIIKLAPRSEFSRAGIDRPYSLNNLRFKAELINDIPYIKVTSGTPIREPFLNFLIEVDWPNGHLLREYTVLLDPPVFMTQSAGSAPATAASDDDSEFRPAASDSTNVVPVLAPGLASSGSFRPAADQAVVSQPRSYDSGTTQTATFIPAPIVQQQTPVNQPAGAHRVKTGETAWSLATAMRPDESISVYQMMIALLRTNPESFINENVNGLKRGYILRVPDYDQIAAINDDEARALVRQQAALWRQYQQSMAGDQAVSAMQKSGSDTEGGAEGSQGNAETGKNAYLEIVSAGTGTSTSSGKDPADMTPRELRAELALAREKVETERVEKEALRKRVDVLEQHVEKMKGMLSIEDEELSRVQSLNLPAEDAGADAGSPDEVADAETAEESAEEVTAQDMAEEAADDAGQAEGKTAKLDEIFFTDEAAEQAATAEQADENMADMSQVAQSKADVMPPQPQAENSPPADLLTQVLNDPVRLATAGGGLLLLALLTGLIIKRRKMAAETETENAFENLDVLAGSAAGTAEADAEEAAMTGSPADVQDEVSGAGISEEELASVTDETSDQVAETTAAAEEEKPRDDVLAEADVYLAYGIYQQAEELLTQAVKDHPERNDYRLKLAETHYAGKNAGAFIDTASEIKKNVDSDDSPEWKKVVVMGMDLCPDDPMFQASLADEVVDTLASEMPAPRDEEMLLEDAEMTALEEAGDESDMDLEDLELDDELLTASDEDEAVNIDLESEVSSLGISEEEQADEIEFDLSDADADEDISMEDEDLSLDAGLSETDNEIEETGETEAKEESLDIEKVVQPDVEETAAEETEPAVAAEAGTDEEDEDEEVVLDLSDEIDVDTLEMDDIEEVKLAANDAPGDEIDEDDFDLSSLGDVDEVSTKLDLARAYLDMGDNEGTRGILEEVLADGNDEQKQEANELMAKLG